MSLNTGSDVANVKPCEIFPFAGNNQFFCVNVEHSRILKSFLNELFKFFDFYFSYKWCCAFQKYYTVIKLCIILHVNSTPVPKFLYKYNGI